MFVRRLLPVSALLNVLILSALGQKAKPAYRDSSLPVGQRAADLLQRMTLEEKVDPLAGARRRMQASSDPAAKEAFLDLAKLFREDSQVSPHDAAAARNKAQHYLVEKTRLGIPGLFQANVLFGDVNPGGKLPISFPRSVGQIPDYYNHKPSRNRSYRFDGSKPLYPFGFGLSYTQFHIDNLRVEPRTIRTGGTAKVSVDITNPGSRAGDEVAQLYIHQRVASRTRPVMQLRGFKRATLEAGQKMTVDFTVTPEDLSLIGVNMNQVVEPGIFDLMVGPSSAETSSVSLEVTN